MTLRPDVTPTQQSSIEHVGVTLATDLQPGAVEELGVDPAPRALNDISIDAARVGTFFARLDRVGVSFRPKIVLRNLSLDIVEGAITCIIGLSGAGKSTILRLLDGLTLADEGTVSVLGKNVSALTPNELNAMRRDIGFAFQGAALFDSLTVGENVALPLRQNRALSQDQIRASAIETLASVGLPDVYDLFPSALSGGMVKRAGFARAIANGPRCVLYDEPTTGLDPITTHILTDLIVVLRKRLNGTAVVVSHDLASIYRMADYVAMLYEGAIISYGTCAQLRSSENPIVQQFLSGSYVGMISL